MLRYLLIAVIAICLAVPLADPVISSALFSLIFLGAIPGTRFSIPFWIMLPATLIASYLLIRWLSRQPLFIGNLDEQEKTARALARKKVARIIAESRADASGQAAKDDYKAIKSTS